MEEIQTEAQRRLLKKREFYDFLILQSSCEAGHSARS